MSVRSAMELSALKIVEEDPRGVAMVILDLMLPGMSGYAVCEALRQRDNHVPILMLSARTLVEDRIRGYDVGADQYLQKPFDLEELLSMVRNLLARQARTIPRFASDGDGTEYEFDKGRIKVNFETFEVTVEGQLLRLTSTEMKLLKYLFDNKGKVVTRSELLEHVWGLSHSPTTRTVDNFMMNLRKYFERNPAKPQHFLSVRGTGYRFVADEDTQQETPSETSEDAETNEA